jgi:hypothetical protein
MSKYVLQLNVTGSNVPMETILDHLPGDEDETVWPDEYSVSIDEDEDGQEVLYAHVPFHQENEARSVHAELGAINGVLQSADSGYMHVHECPTGGSSEAWSCGDRILVDLQAGESGPGEEQGGGSNR